MIVTVLKNRASRSARRLATALGCGVATADSRRATRQDRYVINWGCNESPEWYQRDITWSNFVDAVDVCRDKTSTFEVLSQLEVPCLPFLTEGLDEVRDWLAADGKIIVRHTTTGHSGAGIQIVRQGEVIPNAPLYTRYFKKDCEYRVHTFYGRVILIQQKKRMNEERRPAEGSGLVRTHANGWVFAVNNLDCDNLNYRAALERLALDATTAVGCNHCAVDILVKHKRTRPPVLVTCEINSAPALEATATLNAYAEAFRQKIEELRGEP